MRIERPWTGQEIREALDRTASGAKHALPRSSIEAQADYAWHFSEGQEAHEAGEPLTSNPYLTNGGTAHTHPNDPLTPEPSTRAEAWEAGWTFGDALAADYDRVRVTVPEAWARVAEQIIDDAWPTLVVDRDSEGPAGAGNVAIDVLVAGLDAEDVVAAIHHDPRWSYSGATPLARMVPER